MSWLSTRFQFGALFTLAALILARPSAAQCLHWDKHFNLPVADGDIRCLQVFDDGSGPALYAGGSVHTAGGEVVNSIGRWTGSMWQSLGGGFDYPGTVDALIIYDDGSGPALYACGQSLYSRGTATGGLARWDGSAWSRLDIGGSGEETMAVFDDGSGSALYVGGNLMGTGFPPGTTNIVRWNGSTWSAVGNTQGEVRSLAVHDDGSGPALYSARYYYTSDSHFHDTVARWDGTSWVTIASDFFDATPLVKSLCSFDDGSGNALYIGGSFTHVEGVPVTSGLARWNGTTWSDAGTGLGVGAVGKLRVLDDGSGPRLYAVGSFAGHVARWNGSVWSSVGTNVPNTALDLAAFDAGLGPSIFAGSNSYGADSSLTSSIARFDGSTWQPPGQAATNNGTNGVVESLAEFDDGAGPKLYALGSLTLAGDGAAPGLARWNGSAWSALPSVGFQPTALATVNYGSGLKLLLGGTQIDVWNGAFWTVLPGSNLQPTIQAFAGCDFGGGPSLYAGGAFPTNGGGVLLNGIGRYTGSGWAPLGSGMNGVVLALATFDPGTGTELYAGGTFSTAGGVPVSYIAAWNGTSWASLGGTDNHVYALRVFDDGSGPALFVGGGFTAAGGIPALSVARWNGSSWSPAGDGLDGLVLAFTEFDDGSGSALYASGYFTDSGGVSVPHIAKWTGSSWVSLGGGLDGTAFTMTVFDDGHGPALFAGGSFGAAGAIASANIAQWRGCYAGIESMCFGDGTLLPCPCSNEGLAGHGCQNSASTGGARLTTTGGTHPDTLVLQSIGELSSALSIFLQGNQVLYAGAPFGDGIRCAGGSLKRLYVKSAVSGTSTAPQPGDPSVSARSAALGDTIATGSVRYYQTYYRDPNPTFCPSPIGNTWNVTNGMRVVW